MRRPSSPNKQHACKAIAGSLKRLQMNYVIDLHCISISFPDDFYKGFVRLVRRNTSPFGDELAWLRAATGLGLAFWCPDIDQADKGFMWRQA